MPWSWTTVRRLYLKAIVFAAAGDDEDDEVKEYVQVSEWERGKL